jgi:hypothetical protein
MRILGFGGNQLATAGGFDVANSLRFNEPSSDYLNRTTGTPTNSNKCTFSLWAKRGQLGGTKALMGFHTNDSNRGNFVFEVDKLEVRMFDTSMQLTTNRLFRDVSAWYHIVLAVDTTQGTASNRVKLYINGVQETSFSTSSYPSQNSDFGFNKSGIVFKTTQKGEQNDFFDGYISEFVMVDGQQLDPTSFGEFDEDSGVWKAIDVSGLTFGNNGFYLDFENSGSLGADVSGNGNNFTVNNLTSIDQTTDTCTNNAPTLNPLIPTSGYTFSEGNLKLTTGGSDQTSAGIGTIGITQGKWFWELKLLSANMGNHTHGIISELTDPDQSALQNKVGVTQFRNDDGGEMTTDGTQTDNNYGIFSTGDIMGVALNADDNQISIYKNGSAIVSNFTISTTRGVLFPFVGMGLNCETQINFGSPPYTISSGNSDDNGYGNFEYSVPSGYYALNTKNLAEYG